MSKRVSKMGWAVLGTLVCLSLVILPACGGGGGTTGMPLKNPNDFVQQTIGDIQTLDPAWCYDTASGEQIQYIYETLLFCDGTKTDTFVPVLATEWNASEDGKTIRFHIRSGVKFQNGDTLTPEDVAYSIKRGMVQDVAGGPQWMLYTPLLELGGSRDADGNIQVTFDQINNAVTVDGEWVQFNLVGPYPTLTFYQILANSWGSIVDKNWCIAQGEWDGTEATWESYNNPNPDTPEASKLYNKTNGTGPWALDLWDPGVQIKLVKNDSYWRGSVPFNHVITQVVDEWTSRKLALEQGDADYVYVPRNYIHELDGIAGIQAIKDLPTLQCDAFFFNMAINGNSTFIGSGKLDGNGIPPDFFTDINVRKGFCCAFDYATFLHDAMQNEATQVGSPVIQGLLYFNPNASMYSYDLTKAADYLKAAWGGQVWDKGFKMTVLYNSGNIPRKTACEILAEKLYAVNNKFQISVEPLSWPTILGKIFGVRDMPTFQIGWLADYPDPDDFVTPFMASWGAYADAQSYSNSHVDDLIKQGITTVDPTARQAIYYELQQLYYDDAPGIMLDQVLGRRFFTQYIHGFYFNPVIPGDPGPLYYMSKS
ncbi:MAG: ABC transporter substrate-binding protein [Dehalococcoidia bacterium]